MRPSGFAQLVPRTRVKVAIKGQCKTCRKKSYANAADASIAALRCSRLRGGQPLRIYACPTGNGTWHLTKFARWAA